MLTALEKGVKGGRWYSLMDKVFHPANLEAAWDKVRRNKGAAGVDRQSVEKFGKRAADHLEKLRRELLEGRYRPQPILRRWIPKPGTAKRRPLGIPVVKDRIVQTALRNVMEPLWEVRFEPSSYGFRPGRSCQQALSRVEELLAKGMIWVVDADIQSYFDTIDWAILRSEVEKEVADGKVLSLLEGYLTQEVMEEAKRWTPEAGTPQGAVISPLLANIYLHSVDQKLREAGYEVVRYADDRAPRRRGKEVSMAA
jgi:RNA-directed DNA polymerase